MSSPRVSVVAALSGLVGAVAAVFVLEARRNVLVVAADPPHVAQVAAGDPSASFREVAKLVRPSVVNLTRERVVAEDPDPIQQAFERYFNGRNAPRRPMKERAFGTGFVVRGSVTR